MSNAPFTFNAMGGALAGRDGAAEAVLFLAFDGRTMKLTGPRRVFAAADAVKRERTGALYLRRRSDGIWKPAPEGVRCHAAVR